MKETLKRLKALLMLDLTGSATIEIMPVDLAKAVGIEIPVEKLPFIAVAPKNTDREVETTLQIRPNHEIQITILAVYPNMEEAIIGGGNNKGIVQQVQSFKLYIIFLFTFFHVFYIFLFQIFSFVFLPC